MRASISRLFNICFPQLAICITAVLNEMSAIPKSKARARDATLRNAGEILMRTDHKVPQCVTSRMYWAYVGCEHLTISAQKLRVQFCMHVGNSFFS